MAQVGGRRARMEPGHYNCFPHAQMGPTCARYSVAFIIQVTLTRVVLLTGSVSRTRRCAHWGQSCKEKGHHSSCVMMRRGEAHLSCLPKTPLWLATVFHKCPLIAKEWGDLLRSLLAWRSRDSGVTPLYENILSAVLIRGMKWQ